MEVMTLDVEVANEIRHLIMSGVYKEGDKIPGERSLSEEFGVQRLTLRSGLRMLEEEGLIYSIPRKGYFVSKPRVEKYVSKITSLFDGIQSSSQDFRTSLIKFGETEVDKYLNSETHLPLGTRMYEMKRLRYVDNEPICVDYSFIPKSIAPKLEKYDFEKVFLYDVLQQEYKINLKRSKQKINVEHVEENYRELLQLNPDDSIVLQTGRIYDDQERLVEFSESYMRMDRFVYIT